METQTTRRQVSILNVMLLNESAKRVLEIFPDIVTKLLSMMCERNSTFCAQITSVLTRLIVQCYEEMGMIEPNRWKTMCLTPIVVSLYSHPSSHTNIFNYILPALIVLKPNVLSPALKKEQRQDNADPDSLFNLDLFFLRAATEGSDPVMNALLTLTVLRIDKEKGVIGKNPDDYIETVKREGRVLTMTDAVCWSQCGHDEIRIKLIELITTSLYVS